jgi:two-component system NtrC family sensor kinase
VLIVDDDALAARVVSRVLSAEHDIVEVRSAHDAAERLESGAHFDLVLCDLNMPEMDGMQLHERLRKAKLDIADRIIFMTGGAFTERTKSFAAELPAARWLEKPFDSDRLRSLVRAYVLENTG